MEKASKNAIRNLILYIVMFALIYVIWHAQPIAPLTTKGMQMLAILAGCIWGWSTIELIGPSMIAILLLGFTEGMTVAGALQATIGNYVVVFMLLIALIVQLVEDEGLPKLPTSAYPSSLAERLAVHAKLHKSEQT